MRWTVVLSALLLVGCGAEDLETAEASDPARLEPCRTCGNGIVDQGICRGRSIDEACDGADLRGQTCLTLTGFDGPLSCTRKCLFDTSQCTVALP